MHKREVNYMIFSQLEAVNRFFNISKEIDAEDKRYICQELENIEDFLFDYYNYQSTLSDKILALPDGKIDVEQASMIRADIANIKIALSKEA